MKTTSIAVLALLGLVNIKEDQGASATKLERYFTHHSWEKVNPAEFVQTLSQEVEKEKKEQKITKDAKKSQQGQGKNKKTKKDDSMI